MCPDLNLRKGKVKTFSIVLKTYPVNLPTWYYDVVLYRAIWLSWNKHWRQFTTDLYTFKNGKVTGLYSTRLPWLLKTELL
jgi:hypothetical protein